VSVAVLWCPNGSSQQLEVTIFFVDCVGREERAVELGVESRGRDNFTLVRVELEPDGGGSLLKVMESLRDSGLITC
jgi:hypothetical protein